MQSPRLLRKISGDTLHSSLCGSQHHLTFAIRLRFINSFGKKGGSVCACHFFSAFASPFVKSFIIKVKF